MPTKAASQRPVSARFGGLDGLRAIAVGLVLVYHLFPTLLPGGFLGVDIFFAISGFLITSLLLRELDSSGTISLTGFWRRRARRLLPALALVILVSASLARAVGGDILVALGKQIAGAVFFVSNWVYIAMGSDYFARDNPELFRNTWSLSIEEQFYIVLPLLALLLFRMRKRWIKATVLLVLGIASAVWMAVLSAQGADPTRIYFGSDTHTFGLLLGAASAVLLHQSPEALRRAPRVLTQLGYILVALAGFATLGWLSVNLAEGSPESFQGGFQLATVAAIVVVAAVTRAGAWAGKALDLAPLRWIGERSYGIYLWHWPLLIIFTAAFASSVNIWVLGVLTLVTTLVLAGLSFTFVEQPVRRIGLRRSFTQLFTFTTASPRSRAIRVALLAVLVATIPATSYAVITAPSMSSAAEAIARGQALLDEQQHDSDAAGSEGVAAPSDDTSTEDSETAKDGKTAEGDKPGTKEDSATSSDDDDAKGDSDNKSADGKEKTGGDSDDSDDKKSGTPAKKPPAPPIAPVGTDITAVGDSVMLASLPELNTSFPGITVDAAVSRGLNTGVTLTQQAADQGTLRPVLVVGLGTNGPIEVDDLEKIRITAGTRPIVLVNAYGERDWIPGVNQLLADFAASYRGIVVADWQSSVTGVEGALAGDDIHPNPSGGEIYAASVQLALDELQQPGEALGYALPRR